MKQLDLDLINELYYKQNQSRQQIADALGVAKITLLRFLERESIVLGRRGYQVPELKGQVFGRLTVESYVGKNKHGKNRWLCQCSCGNNKVIDQASFTRGLTTSCGCLKNSIAFKGYGDISRNYWRKTQKSAAQRGLDFSITIEKAWEIFISQDNRCAISGVEINLCRDYNSSRKQSASIDRIDSSLGYVEGNIQWVHKQINFMKGNMRDEDFVSMCVLVAEYHKEV